MKKILTAFVTLLILFAGTVAVLLATLDVNTYRPQIAEALSKKTGRTVKLGGPIKLGFSSDGVTLTIRDVGIGNPAWASRPTMAGMGSFKLGVALMPLLSRKFDVTEVEIVNADILVETSKDGKANWDMTSTDSPAEKKSAQKPTASQPVAIHVEKISITDSQLAMRDKEGKTSVYKVKKMSVGREGTGVALNFTGEANGAPVALKVKTGIRDLMAIKGTWPLDANLTYANYTVTAKGKADADKKVLSLSSYEVKTGKTNLQGQLNANWGGVRPALRGTLISDKVDMADLKPETKTSGGDHGKPAPASSGPKRVFSTAPLQLDALKTADASFDVKIGEITVGDNTLRQVTTKLELANGRLTLAPLKAQVGNNAISAQVRVDAASSPSQMALSFNAPNIDLADVLKLIGLPAFLSGKGSTEIDLAGSGNSMHAIAGTAVGRVNITATGGNVAPSATRQIASALMEMFAPGSGAHGLNCLAARFIVKDGIMRDNGILADTSATTVAGSGGFNLGTETVNMTLRAKPKVMNVADIMPPMHVGGTLLEPSFTLDSSGTVRNVVGLLTNGTVNSGVPTLINQPGQNACVYTLDHPAVAPSGKSPLLQTPAAKAQDQIKNLGGALKGLLGR
ncbi:MAG: AsmA family protein [Alphaproteobacteria bacterium]|nr:AsmA family protein [Alphaproteobacteria bacterium]